MQASPELRLMLAPAGEYARLAALGRESTTFRALSRPALSLLIVGAASGAASTGRVDAQVVLSGALCWSFAIAIQVMASILLVRSAPDRHLDVRRSLELWFLGHAPWSLWILTVAAVVFTVPALVSLEVALLSATVPSVWTAAVVYAFGRHVLRSDRRRALWQTAVHQAVTWSSIIGYLSVVTQIWPRILGQLAA